MSGILDALKISFCALIIAVLNSGTADARVSFTAYYPLNPAIGPVGTRVKFTYEFKIVETADTYNVLYVPNAFAEDVTCRNYNGQPFYVEGDTGECTLYYTFTEDDVRRGYGAHSIQHREATLVAWIQATGTRGHHLACASKRSSTVICPGNSPKADHELRLKPDHPMGSGQAK